jgi:hypothetical protein
MKHHQNLDWIGYGGIGGESNKGLNPADDNERIPKDESGLDEYLRQS